jgi:methylenetetrahydrofolate reductase (NADPH)
MRPPFTTASIEITARDREARDAVLAGMAAGSEVYIADLPDQPPDVIIEAAAEIRGGGLEPVPHIVARNIASHRDLDDLLTTLRAKADVTRVLVTAGDRATSRGPFDSALDILRGGRLQACGVTRSRFVCFPEGHPRVPASVMKTALREKILAAEDAELDVLLISQFVFEAEPVLRYVRALRSDRIEVPLRVGVAGPAPRDRLLEFGRDLGVGASLGALERHGGMAGLVTPGELLRDFARAQSEEPGLRLDGAHFFPFGSPADCVSWTSANL